MNKSPIIGICTFYSKNSSSPDARYVSFLRHSARLPGQVYIFSPRDIDWAAKTIKGFVLVNRHLIKKSMPFPQAVYNKLENRHQEAMPLVRQMWKKFNSIGIKIFNPKFFNKIEIHRVLSANNALSPYIPETMVDFSLASLDRMLHKHSGVFIKPGSGSLGQGVVKICQTPKGYRYQYRLSNKNVTATINKLSALLRRIDGRIGKRPIIQQAIDLATYQGRVFDLRILMQKNGQGRWVRTYSFGKAAAPGSIASNVAAGGRVVHYHTILSATFPDVEKRKRVEEQITRICSLIPSALDKHFSNLGELGIDLGIDTAGRVWLIEVNSKYSRHVFPRQVRVNSIVNSLSYAQFLAKGQSQ
ncbi:MAG: YheC/YheD family protein [Clostridia bacterium]|nr:YheC/YheD family protein [Clostridia bacterium]